MCKCIIFYLILTHYYARKSYGILAGFEKLFEIYERTQTAEISSPLCNNFLEKNQRSLTLFYVPHALTAILLSLFFS